MTLPLAIIHATRPTGGLKIVAERTTIETRTRRPATDARMVTEKRIVRDHLHPTKGWRRAHASKWSPR